MGLSLAGAGAILFASKGLFSKALFHGGIDFVTMTSLRAVLALPMFFALGLSRGVKPWRASGKCDRAGRAGRRAVLRTAGPWSISARWS